MEEGGEDDDTGGMRIVWMGLNADIVEEIGAK